MTTKYFGTISATLILLLCGCKEEEVKINLSSLNVDQAQYLLTRYSKIDPHLEFDYQGCRDDGYLGQILRVTGSTAVPRVDFSNDPKVWVTWAELFSATLEGKVRPRCEWVNTIIKAQSEESEFPRWQVIDRSNIQPSRDISTVVISKKLVLGPNQLEPGVVASFKYVREQSAVPQTINVRVLDGELLAFLRLLGMPQEYQLQEAFAGLNPKNGSVSIKGQLRLADVALADIPFSLVIASDDVSQLGPQLAESLSEGLIAALSKVSSFRGAKLALLQDPASNSMFSGQLGVAANCPINVKAIIKDMIPAYDLQPTAAQLSALKAFILGSSGLPGTATQWTMKNGLRLPVGSELEPALLTGVLTGPKEVTWTMRIDGTIAFESQDDAPVIRKPEVKARRPAKPSSTNYTAKMIDSALARLFPNLKRVLSCAESPSWTGRDFDIGFELPDYPCLLLPCESGNSGNLDELLTKVCTESALIEAAKLQWPAKAVHKHFGIIPLQLGGVNLHSGEITINGETRLPHSTPSHITETGELILPFMERIIACADMSLPGRRQCQYRLLSSQEVRARMGESVRRAVNKHLGSFGLFIGPDIKVDDRQLVLYLEAGSITADVELKVELPWQIYLPLARSNPHIGHVILLPSVSIEHDKIALGGFGIRGGLVWTIYTGPVITLVNPELKFDFTKHSMEAGLKIAPTALVALQRTGIPRVFGEPGFPTNQLFVQLRGWVGCDPDQFGASGTLVVLKEIPLAEVKLERQPTEDKFELSITTKKSIDWWLLRIDGRLTFLKEAIQIGGSDGSDYAELLLIGFHAKGKLEISPSPDLGEEAYKTAKLVSIQGTSSLFGILDADVTGTSDLAFKDPHLDFKLSVREVTRQGRKGYLKGEVMADKDRVAYNFQLYDDPECKKLVQELKIERDRKSDMGLAEFDQWFATGREPDRGWLASHGALANIRMPAAEEKLLLPQEVSYAYCPMDSALYFIKPEDESLINSRNRSMPDRWHELQRMAFARVSRTHLVGKVDSAQSLASLNAFWNGQHLVLWSAALDAVLFFPDVRNHANVFIDVSEIFAPLRDDAKASELAKKEVLRFAVSRMATDDKSKLEVRSLGRCGTVLQSASGDRSAWLIPYAGITPLTRKIISITDEVYESLGTEAFVVTDLEAHFGSLRHQDALIALSRLDDGTRIVSVARQNGQATHVYPRINDQPDLAIPVETVEGSSGKTAAQFGSLLGSIVVAAQRNQWQPGRDAGDAFYTGDQGVCLVGAAGVTCAIFVQDAPHQTYSLSASKFLNLVRLEDVPPLLRRGKVVLDPFADEALRSDLGKACVQWDRPDNWPAHPMGLFRRIATDIYSAQVESPKEKKP